MDTRNTPNNTIIEAWLARSTDGGTTFFNELISSEQSPTSIPGTNVRFGDYIDIDYLGQNVVPVWTDERLGGFNQEIFTSEISDILGIEPVANSFPDKFELYQNYPNPFNPVTKIKFGVPNSPNKGLPASQRVQIIVFDILGREVATIVNQQLNPGIYEIEWNGKNYLSGTYFYTLTMDGYKETKAMVLLK
jgi:hypothetical protein